MDIYGKAIAFFQIGNSLSYGLKSRIMKQGILKSYPNILKGKLYGFLEN
jgi:hypothetical protein